MQRERERERERGDEVALILNFPGAFKRTNKREQWERVYRALFYLVSDFCFLKFCRGFVEKSECFEVEKAERLGFFFFFFLRL